MGPCDRDGGVAKSKDLCGCEGALPGPRDPCSHEGGGRVRECVFS